LVPKEQKKVERVINFMKKGLQSLSDDLEETVTGLNDFIKSLNKALKDLKEVEVVPQAQTVSTSSKKVIGSAPIKAKTAAASTLFNLLSGGAPSAPTSAPSLPVGAPSGAPSLPAVPTAAAAGPPKAGGPPKRPPSGTGPPKAPVASAGPPKAPVASAGPPARSNLPSAPKLPPAPGSGPPNAPSGATVQTPSFAKRPAPAPAGPPGRASTSAAPQAGGGLSSLRDEMLEELNRLKKIMRGE